MSRETAGNVERKAVALGPYGFDFGQEGTWNDPPMCDFCGEEYEGLGVQVNLDCGFEICPDCLLAGPKAVAEKMRAHPHKDAGMEGMAECLHDAAEVIGRLDSFTQLPRGILALKIAEGYMAYREAGKEA